MDNLKGKKPAGKKPNLVKGKLPKFGGSPMSFFTKITNAILIILLVTFLYSMIFNIEGNKEKIALSQLASDINAGLVQKVDVKNDNLTITYAPTSTATSSII